MALFRNKNCPVLPFFTSCLDARSLGEHGHKAAEERAKSASPVYRDELSKVKRKTGRREMAPDAEKDRFCGEPIAGEKKVAVRVKVKMTKREAARLLGKCGDGGVLEFRDVARVLVQIPMSHVSVVRGMRPNDGVVGELKSIPEEDEERM
ncbi:hypothetical protein EUGRSUZ_D01747 [Eucalyptus grandis]|uniref:DUF7890 domain-containing protein n=1 Tax=Eucalyptus grandis TaxID=71139 RepID=A0A059CGU9_EUCGR|nr:hypothetical protein EUGRSUZ_D01747 [Eucalyptus grandis]